MSNIIEELVSLMIQASIELPRASGKKKKEWVLIKLREIITLDNKIEDLIIAVIDTLISVEKGQLVFNPKIKNNCLGCLDNLKKCFK